MINRSITIEQDEQRVRPTKSEVECLLADNTLARTLMGWEPSVGLEEGLKLTIGWIEKNMDRYHPDEYRV